MNSPLAMIDRERSLEDAFILKEMLAKIMSSLSQREQRILIKRFNLDGQGEYSPRELAKEEGCSYGRATQLIRIALLHARTAAFRVIPQDDYDSWYDKPAIDIAHDEKRHAENPAREQPLPEVERQNNDAAKELVEKQELFCSDMTGSFGITPEKTRKYYEMAMRQQLVTWQMTNEPRGTQWRFENGYPPRVRLADYICGNFQP